MQTAEDSCIHITLSLGLGPPPQGQTLAQRVGLLHHHQGGHLFVVGDDD